MAVSINRVLLAGNLTRDPEVKFLANERAVGNFSLALNRKYKNNAGELVEDVTYVEVEAWGRTAELVGQYLTKGSPCFIEGRLKLDIWEKDGQKNSRLRVVADTVQFLGARPAGDQSGNGSADRAAPRSQAGSNQRAPASQEVPAYDGDEPPF